MKKLLTFLVIFCFLATYAQISWQGGTNPEQTASGTILFDKTGTGLASYSGTIYAHIGVTLNGNAWQNVKGSWGNNTTQPALTLVSGNVYKLDLTPTIQSFFGVSSGSITAINVVFRSADGSQQTNPDYTLNVGNFQLSLLSPTENSSTIYTGSGSISVVANNTGGNASYTLYQNGTALNTNASTSFYTYGITTPVNGTYTVTATIGSVSLSKKFYVVVQPTTVSEALPSGMQDGINYNTSDPTKATLVLNAPGKDFVYIAGDFNSWSPTASYAMKKDPTTGKFWLELTGLTSGQYYSYQYWVCDNTPATNSPKVVKTADPFSTLVLSPFDDGEIQTLGVFPGLPAYPAGQEREVSVLQTGPIAYWNYNWTSTTKPNASINKKELVAYEVMVRDFDSNRTFQDLINRIDYFKNLKINAIQLMPVMEFEGNESWGYNTVFHMALDKRYGPPAKLKEFIDLCHQNGIAVILDIALNHVYGRSPLERIWMNDADGDGWGDSSPRVSSDNPYCNQYATHAYGVGTDINHFREPNNLTNYYVQRTIKLWINEYKIDGFRWDLTKGFTNSCASGDETCTNSYLADRVAKLKWYADMQWTEDPNFIVIFEHLGTGGSYNEEVEWANYRKTETPAKGIIQWRKMTDGYANFLKGNSTDLSGIYDASERFIGYAESHDEERVVYKAITESGQTNGNLTKALARMPAMGAVLFPVPGPKMTWHFGDLGWSHSLWTCTNGTVSYSAPDCKLATKPQPQWANNWMADAQRLAIYQIWSKLIDLKIKENVFENGSHFWNFTQTGRPRLDIRTSTSPQSYLSYVVVFTNSTDNTYTFNAGFPYTGTWYNMMDNTPLTVTDTNMQLSIEPNGFRMYGNYLANMGNDDVPMLDDNISMQIVENPVRNKTIRIKYDAKDATKVEFYLFSAEGRYLTTASSYLDKGEITIPANYPSGTYLLQMISDKGKGSTKVIIK